MIVLFFALVTGNMTISGDFEVDELKCIEVQVSNLESNGELEVEEKATTEGFQATDLTADIVYANTITSNTGTVTIIGDLRLGTEESTSFIQKSWSLHSHEQFSNSALNWTGILRKCQSNHFLVGDCENNVQKRFEVGKHDFLRIQATFHMLEHWKGEKAYLTVDGKEVWSHSETTRDSHLDLCGSGVPDAKLGISIDVTVPHSQQNVLLEFGAALEGNCQAFIGVDHVIIYTKFK